MHYEICATKRSRRHLSSLHNSLLILFIISLFTKNTSTVQFSLKYFKLLYKWLKTCTRFLQTYGKWVCIREFGITQYQVQPSLILRLGKIVRVSKLVPHTLIGVIVVVQWSSMLHVPIVRSFLVHHFGCRNKISMWDPNRPQAIFLLNLMIKASFKSWSRKHSK